jgi:hypothetical protein
VGKLVSLLVKGGAAVLLCKLGEVVYRLGEEVHRTGAFEPGLHPGVRATKVIIIILIIAIIITIIVIIVIVVIVGQMNSFT